MTLLPSGNVIVPPCAADTVWVTLAIVPATITPVDADLVESATLVAEMFTVNGVGTEGGAVYRPVPSIVPTVPFPLGMPFTAHVTDLSGFPALVMLAANCRVEAVGTAWAPTGELETATAISLVTVTEASACLEVSA